MTPVQSCVDTILQMSPSLVIRLDHALARGVTLRLRRWFDDLPASDYVIMERLLGHSLSYLLFQVPDGFIEGILSCWIPNRHIFQFGSEELTPTLEEYVWIASLSLVGPYARVTVGHMRQQFLSTTGLTQAVLLSEVTSGHIVSLDFMIDQFSSLGSYDVFKDDFRASEDMW